MPPLPRQDEFIRRNEYENRHNDIEKDIVEMKQGMTLVIQELNRKINETNNKLDVLNESVLKNKITIWQFIAMTAINFLFSGGLIGLLSITGHFH